MACAGLIEHTRESREKPNGYDEPTWIGPFPTLFARQALLRLSESYSKLKSIFKRFFLNLIFCMKSLFPLWNRFSAILWSNLPEEIRTSNSLGWFKRNSHRWFLDQYPTRHICKTAFENFSLIFCVRLMFITVYK